MLKNKAGRNVARCVQFMAMGALLVIILRFVAGIRFQVNTCESRTACLDSTAKLCEIGGAINRH